jgi:hypothetical protein
MMITTHRGNPESTGKLKDINSTAEAQRTQRKEVFTLPLRRRQGKRFRFRNTSSNLHKAGEDKRGKAE